MRDPRERHLQDEYVLAKRHRLIGTFLRLFVCLDTVLDICKTEYVLAKRHRLYKYVRSCVGLFWALCLTSARRSVHLGQASQAHRYVLVLVCLFRALCLTFAGPSTSCQVSQAHRYVLVLVLSVLGTVLDICKTEYVLAKRRRLIGTFLCWFVILGTVLDICKTEYVLASVTGS